MKWKNGSRFVGCSICCFRVATLAFLKPNFKFGVILKSHFKFGLNGVKFP